MSEQRGPVTDEERNRVWNRTGAGWYCATDVIRRFWGWVLGHNLAQAGYTAAAEIREFNWGYLAGSNSQYCASGPACGGKDR